jgi:hypothetical protein
MITCLIWLGDGDLIDLVCLDATSRLRKTILFLPRAWMLRDWN